MVVEAERCIEQSMHRIPTICRSSTVLDDQAATPSK
jgi:hypothetical protein